ncbi:MAG: hypothetical protein FWC41_10390, partial [Firmicutes bacterium]|nr:hypothetical protein [Bacillota bacterium]
SPCYLPSYWPNFSSFDYVSLTGASAVPRLTSFSMPESIEASLELTLSEKLTPVVDHKLLSEFTHNSNGTKTWKAKITKPTKLWITACDYALIEFTASDMDVQLIYSRKYDDNIKKYKIPEAVSSVIEYCTKHLGVLKFTSNNKLVMIERSSSGGDGGNAGNGWVEWSEYIFTENNLKNPLQGANANEVFAHEIVHLWWGTLSIMFPFHDDIWSDEGLTVYTTYRIMKERHGEDYAKKNYIDIWENAVNIQNRGYYYRHPEAIEKLPEQYRVQLKQSYNKTNKYCRMPLMILKAEKLLGGEKKFDKILQDIYKKYSESEEDFTYQNFLDECGLEKDDLNLA